MITEIDLSQYYIKKQEIESAFDLEGDAATIIKNAIAAKPNLGTSHNDAARGDHNHDGRYLQSYTPPTASTVNAGIVQLSTSVNNASIDQAATPSAVKAAYQLAETKTVTVNKLSTATTGYLATYEITQGGTLLGKIEIPKDFLIKSGTVKTSQAANNPEQGYLKGDKYIDFVINVKEGSGVDSHIYVNLKDLIDVYKADGSSLQLINNEFSIKENGVKASHIANGVIENRHISTNAQIPFSKLDIRKEDIVGLEIPAYDTDTLYYGDETTIELGNNNRFKVKDNVFADKSHNHGDISSTGTIGSSPNKPLITGESGKIITGTFGNQPNTFSEGNHGHGNLSNTGTLNSNTETINKIVVTDNYNQLKTISTIPLSNLGLQSASTTTNGIVQLNDSINNNSTTQAATANAIKQLNEKFGSNNSTYKNAHTHTESQITDLYTGIYKTKITAFPPGGSFDVEGYEVDVANLNTRNPATHYPDETVYIAINITDFKNNRVDGLNTTITCDKGYFLYNGQLKKSISDNIGKMGVWWIPSEWGLCTISANDEKIQILVGGYKTYTVDNYYTIYYDDKMCHMSFYHNYGSTNFSHKTDWTDFGSALTLPQELRPERFVTIVTARKHFHMLIKTTGVIAWKNLNTESITNLKQCHFLVSWKKR